ncbi:uncharacterized protein [Nicotiana sylvestris]|uniref:uncharacterized protein n=1 Tax=Nicotiana sylvestris TaxID=4096 RepID=UPI00388C9F7F
MITESSFVQPVVPLFDRHYDHWMMLMENFLPSKEYWGLVEDGIPAATEGMTDAQKKNIDDQRLKDLKPKNFLFQALDRSVLETILKKETAKDIWDSMKQKYQGNTRVKREQLQSLRKEFKILHMKVGEIVNEFFARTLTIANKLKTNGEDKGDAGVVENILRSMTPKFNYVCMSSIVADEQALKIAHGEQSGGRGQGFGRGGREKGRGRFDKATVECYNYHKLGHFQWECPQKEKVTNYAETQ